MRIVCNESAHLKLINLTSVLAFVAFYVTVCYHTIYATPWILPPLAFYGLDMLVRMLRHRIKDATLVACDDQMTIVRSPHLLTPVID